MEGPHSQHVEALQRASSIVWDITRPLSHQVLVGADVVLHHRRLDGTLDPRALPVKVAPAISLVSQGRVRRCGCSVTSQRRKKNFLACLGYTWNPLAGKWQQKKPTFWVIAVIASWWSIYALTEVDDIVSLRAEWSLKAWMKMKTVWITVSVGVNMFSETCGINAEARWWTWQRSKPGLYLMAFPFGSDLPVPLFKTAVVSFLRRPQKWKCLIDSSVYHVQKSECSGTHQPKHTESLVKINPSKRNSNHRGVGVRVNNIQTKCSRRLMEAKFDFGKYFVHSW